MGRRRVRWFSITSQSSLAWTCARVALPRWMVVATLACALLVLFTTPLRADDAPMQETTQGLVPGVPRTTVRMAAEKVDINVTERDGEVHALVTASFDMFNRGPGVNLTIGFPLFSGSGAYYSVPGGYADFDTARIADFHAASGQMSFVPIRRKITAKLPGDIQFAGDWYVWQMDYPGGGKTTNVQVSYDQTLNYKRDHGYALTDYVLRTGALWDGTIGDATVTMSSTTGGTFIASDQATSATPTQVVWHLTDVKPTFDPSAVYIPADKWRRLTTAEARLAGGSASADDYASATEAFLDIVAGSAVDENQNKVGLPYYYWTSGRPPQPLVNRYDEVLGWANQATRLEPGNAAAFEALGDMQYLLAFPMGHGPDPTCRPVTSAATLRHALDLGSPTAQAKLDFLDAYFILDARTNTVQRASLLAQNLPECESPLQAGDVTPTGNPTSTPDTGASPAATIQDAPDALTDGLRAEILAAVDRANAAWASANQSLDTSVLNSSVAGQALRDDMAEVDQLRRQGHFTRNSNTSFVVIDVSLDAPGHATVRTRESWSDETYDRASGRLLQRAPVATYDETYVVEYLSGGWIVTSNDLH
jgi:hypothetical protein